MLELKNITKTYKTGTFVQHALKKVSLMFRKNEFVAILGQSGSGKTTLLNIIGGLDRYDSGDLIINGTSTKEFKDTKWDSYRNNSIGFVFQSYNLINHISVLENIEMSMTLSGVNSKVRKEKAKNALEKVGLLAHANKKPNQLSGGQMQRIAIARALVNDPDIILADEPTGALDSKTSVQIMELIKEIAKEKLVIMVTHNPELAHKYASRIVELKDGELLSDSNEIKNSKELKSDYQLKKTAMSFFTALKLSFNNIKTKKGRTFLISAASSIGIIGIAIIMALSNGFQLQIDEFESKTLSSMPIIINKSAIDIMGMVNPNENTLPEFPNDTKIHAFTSQIENLVKTNTITKDYIDYVKKLDQDNIDGIAYINSAALNILSKNNDTYKLINSNNYEMLPVNPENQVGIIGKTYDVLAGDVSKEKGLILMVDSKNQVDKNLLEELGITADELDFEKILNQEYKLVLNNQYYNQIGNVFAVNTNFASLYNNTQTTPVKVVAIIRYNKDREDLARFSQSALLYNDKLINYVIENNKDSNIVKEQEKINYNILTGEPFTNEQMSFLRQTPTKEEVLGLLGKNTVPSEIRIYPKDFASKDKVTSYLDKYNEFKEEKDKVSYTDQANLITSLSSNIMGAITIVLLAFSSIALLVSSIMIGVITYISVIERTKEIGILRALGARKKDISRVFNAETFIIGVASGALGIIVAQILTIPINQILYHLTELKDVARLNPVHALILVGVSITLTLLGGFIPARMASKKDPVEALRTE